MEYQLIKGVHMTCAALSISGFVIRGALAIRQSPIIQQRWIKIVPHIVDTLLLVSAITLAVMASISPLQHGWLGMKIILLILYIGFGFMTLRFARSNSSRIGYYIGAILVFCSIVAIAISKQPFILF